MNSTYIGFGYDSHRFKDGSYIILGGIRIVHNRGIDAHSDGDVLLHAICDALLGAAGLGDIGMHFPDSDQEYDNIQSSMLLKNVVDKIEQSGFRVGNLDSTIVLEKPKLSAHISAMQLHISGLLNTAPERVNIKATTNEGMGLIGRGEGIAAFAVAVINQQALD